MNEPTRIFRYTIEVISSAPFPPISQPVGANGSFNIWGKLVAATVEDQEQS